MSTADRGRVIGWLRTPYPLLVLWPPFSNEMAPDLVNGVNGRALVTKLAPLLMEKRHNLDEMTMELVREKAEQFVLDLIAGKLLH